MQVNLLDVAEAMKPKAPILHDHMITEGVNPPPTKPSNIAKRIEFNKSDTKAGFAEAEVVIERDYTTQAVHQGYIEPHAALASASEDGQVQVWSTTQGHFQVRGFCAKLLNIDTSQIRVTPTEIGGGFGGKTVVYLEPLAIRLSQKSGKPVKMTMTREEVFRASGPAPGGNIKVKKGAKTAYGVTFNTIGMVETLEAIKNSEHYKTPPKPGYARGVAAGFWFNVGADSSAASHVGEDGSVTVISGNPDIGGSRASLALRAAEELGRHQGERGAAAADVGIARDHRDRAVLADM